MAIPINTKTNILDEQEQKYIGLKLPLEKSNDMVGYFESTKLSYDAVKYNIVNLIKTNQGERLFHPTLGMGLKRYLFENISDSVKLIIKDEITSTFKLWLPFVGIKKLEIDSTYNSNMDRNKLKLNLEFFIKNNPTMLDSIEIVIE